MQHTGVVATGDDRAVGRTARPLLQEVLLDHRLHLPLAQAGPRHLAGPLVGLRRDATGLPHPRYLLGLLAQPQLMQDRAGGHQTHGRLAAAGGAIELTRPGLQHQRLHQGMAPHTKGDRLGPLQIARQPLAQLTERMGQMGAEPLHRPLHTPAEAVPHLRRRIPGLHEQHERVLRTVRQEQRHRPRLIEAGEVPEIAVLPEGMLHIRVVGHQRRRRDHRRRAAEAMQKTVAPVGECGGLDSSGRHGSADPAAGGWHNRLNTGVPRRQVRHRP